MMFRLELRPSRIGGIGDRLAIEIADADGADNVMKRNIGDGERSRCADDAEHRRIVLRIRRKDHGDDLRFAHEAFGEERPHGPVDHTAGENFFFGRTAFAFDEAAGEASGCVSVLAVIHREREKSLSGLGVFIGARGDQHHGISRPDNDGTIGLLGQFPGLDGDLTATEVDFKSMFHVFVEE